MFPKALETKETEKTIGHVRFKFRSDYDTETGQVLDTAVIIGDHVLCWISGDNIDEFAKKLDNLIGEYHI